MTTTWVAGGGGLLGSAVIRAHGPDGLVAGPGIRWGTPEAADDIAASVDALVAAADGGSWRILWFAGSGTTSTEPGRLEEELAVFRGMLSAVERLPARVSASGLIVLASSAGGVYGGSGRGPFDENSAPRPLGAYGAAKLAAEDALRAVAERSGIRALVLRIANLYGPGQNLAKPQGLVSQLALSSVTRRPMSVFVPLDTLRDYLFVDDAARMALAAAERAAHDPSPWHVKVLCSGRAMSVAAVLADFARVARPRPVVFTGASPQALAQGRDVRLRSSVWTDLDALAVTTFASGIARTVADVRRSRFAALK